MVRGKTGRAPSLLVLLALAALLPAMAPPSPTGARSAVAVGGAPPSVALPLFESWAFDVTTTGQPIAWTSPTAVDPGAPSYLARFLLERVEVRVSWLGIPFGPFDVTDQIPPEYQAFETPLAGPAPVTVLDAPVVAPPPPEPPSIAADLLVGLDGAGHGFFSGSNIVLGTVLVDLGFFGTVNAQITSVRLVGRLDLAPRPWRLLPLP